MPSPGLVTVAAAAKPIGNFKIISNLVTPYHKELAPLVERAMADSSSRISLPSSMICVKEPLQIPAGTVSLLTDYISESCETVLRQAGSMEDQLHTKIAAHSSKWLHFDTSW